MQREKVRARARVSGTALPRRIAVDKLEEGAMVKRAGRVGERWLGRVLASAFDCLCSCVEKLC
jgi:hypothetical protein